MKVNIRNYKKGNAERLIDVSIDKWDTYSVDHTAALVILPLLLQLRQTKQGIPNELTKCIGGDLDNNYTFDFIKDDQHEVFDMLCQKWDEIIDKMIWSFQQIVDENYDDRYHHGKLDFIWEPITVTNPMTGIAEQKYEIVDEYPEGHWYDMVGHRIHLARIQEGLELFGKYYMSLWT